MEHLDELIESRSFLGSEFLLWLWYKAECYDGFFELRHHGDVEVVFDDRLRLEAYLAETERNTFKGGSPAWSPEAKLALREGKRPTRARLKIVRDGREWRFKFKAEDFALSTLKIPSLLSERDDEKFLERMDLIEEVEDILEDLYEEFVVIRTSPLWEDRLLPAIQDWIFSDAAVGPDHYPDDLLEEAYRSELEEVAAGGASE